MSFESLKLVLNSIANQPQWEKQKEYHHLVECWQKVVSEKIAKHTKLLYLQRKILWIATPNAVWAQNLTLQRYSLLQKLNQKMTQPLTDIRFSSARWYQNSQDNKQYIDTLELHPSFVKLNVDFPIATDTISSKVTLNQAFEKWQETIKRRSPLLVKCPLCESPTPEGELERWEMCAYCFQKKCSY